MKSRLGNPLKSRLANPRGGSAAGGFTLVELLVVITIIGILTAMSLMALAGAREAARRGATQATVYKLHNLILNKREEYRTRRIPVDTSFLPNQNAAGQVRLDALRELMRMEMPERWSDIVDAPVTRPQPHSVRDTSGSAISRPSVSQAYLTYYQQRVLPYQSSPDYLTFQSAACLYLIVTKFCDDGRDGFQESEIGTVNTAKLPVFMDGWGNPICFLRRAPGFHSDAQTQDAIRDPDPFDSGQVEYNGGTSPIAGGPVRIAPFALFPLIYSAGPDGKYGIQTNDTLRYSTQFNDPYVDTRVGSSPTLLVGTAYDDDAPAPTFIASQTPAQDSAILASSTNHPVQVTDNIHNQSILGK